MGKCMHTSIWLFVWVLELCFPSLSLSHEYVPINIDLWIGFAKAGHVKHCHQTFRNLCNDQPVSHSGLLESHSGEHGKYSSKRAKKVLS